MGLLDFLKEEVYPVVRERVLPLLGKLPHEDPVVRKYEEKKAVEYMRESRQEPLERRDVVKENIKKLLSQSNNFNTLPTEIQDAVVNKLATQRDIKAFEYFLKKDPELQKIWAEMPDKERKAFIVQNLSPIGLREAYLTPIEPAVIGVVTRSLPITLGATVGAYVGEAGAKTYENVTGKPAPWWLAPVVDFATGMSGGIVKGVKGVAGKIGKKEVQTAGKEKLSEELLQAIQKAKEETQQNVKELLETKGSATQLELNQVKPAPTSKVEEPLPKTEEVVPPKTEEVIPHKVEEPLPKTEEVVPPKVEEAVPTSKVEEVVPPKVEEAVLSRVEEGVSTPEVEVQKPRKIMWNTDDEYYGRSLSEVLDELKNAEAGKRIFYHETEEVKAIPSTFPEWIPQDLRKKSLLEKVVKYIENDIVPPEKNTREWRLYEVIRDEIEKRADLYRYKAGTSLEPQPTQKEIEELAEALNFYTVNPAHFAWKALRQLDTIISSNVTGKIRDTKIDRWLRTFADIEGFRHMSRSEKDAFLKGAYYPTLGKIAIGDETANALSKIAERVNEQVGAEVTIRYLEEPTARAVVKDLAPDIAKELDEVVSAINKNSEEMLQRGLIKPSQHAKWGDRYLSRIYLNVDDTPVEITTGAKKIKIEKGRVIESIMDVPKGIREQLGFVENPKLLVARTLAKQSWNIALDDFFRKALQVPEVVDPEATRFLLRNPFKDVPELEKLPEVMSPHYAKNHFIPYIEDFIRVTNKQDLSPVLKEFKKIVNEMIDALDNYTPNKNYIKLDKSGFGVFSGLPVNKDIFNIIQGIRTIVHPEEITSKADKIVSGLLAWVKIAKVPLNFPGAYVRNFLSNVFQWPLSGAEPTAVISYMGKALRELKHGGQFYDEAKSLGLFNNTFASEEIIKVLKQIKLDTDKGIGRTWNIFVDTVNKLGGAYGKVDELWKLARYIYAREVEKLTPEDAILMTQRTHFDYSLTYPIIKAMREPVVGKGFTIAKVAGSIFPTFTQKALGFLYESIIERPATLFTILTTPILVKNTIEKVMEDKYGKEYHIAKKALPDWQQSIYNIVLMDENKNVHVINMEYLLPWGSWSSFVEGVTEGVSQPTYERAERKIMQGIGQLGLFSNPIAGMAIVAKTGKDPFSGGDTSIIDYAIKTLLPHPVVSFTSSMESRTRHPALALSGSPVFTYNQEVWKNMFKSKINRIRKEIEEEKGRLRSKYLRGAITKEEYAEELRKLNEIKTLLFEDLLE